MIISVTREDILQGVAGNCHRCPVARAAKRAFDDPRVTVTPGKLNYYDGFRGERRSWLLLPVAARDFMYSFDTGAHVAPFEFEVTP